jgi:hypothetical protein
MTRCRLPYHVCGGAHSMECGMKIMLIHCVQKEIKQTCLLRLLGRLIYLGPSLEHGYLDKRFQIT